MKNIKSSNRKKVLIITDYDLVGKDGSYDSMEID